MKRKDSKRRSNPEQGYWKESVHTPLSYWFLVIAIGIEFVLGFRNISTLFGILCILEGVFGIIGLLFLDMMHGTKSKSFIYPDKFKKVHPELFIRFAITFGVIVVIQIVFQIIPLITTTELALAIVFCSVIEEYFFRGILLESAFKSARRAKSDQKFTVWKYSAKKKKAPKEITYVELLAILLSAVIFASFHINYYGNPNLLLTVFMGGLWLSAVYWWNKDLTAVILAHFMLNIIFVYQFWRVML